MSISEKNIQQINALCSQHNVDELYAFGSVNTDKFSEKSDVDLLVQFAQMDVLKYFDNYMSLKENLELVLKRKVDLVENQAIKNPIFRNIVDREKVLIYGRKNS